MLHLYLSKNVDKLWMSYKPCNTSIPDTIAAFIASSWVVLVTQRDAMNRELFRAVSKSKGEPENIFLAWFYFFVFDFCAKHWEPRLKVQEKGLLMWIFTGNNPLKYDSLEYNSFG